jgi:hypothetical protein
MFVFFWIAKVRETREFMSYDLRICQNKEAIQLLVCTASL